MGERVHICLRGAIATEEVVVGVRSRTDQGRGLIAFLCLAVLHMRGYQDSSSVTPTNLPGCGVKTTRNWEVVTVGKVTSLASLATGAAGS